MSGLSHVFPSLTSADKPGEDAGNSEADADRCERSTAFSHVTHDEHVGFREFCVEVAHAMRTAAFCNHVGHVLVVAGCKHMRRVAASPVLTAGPAHVTGVANANFSTDGPMGQGPSQSTRDRVLGPSIFFVREPAIAVPVERALPHPTFIGTSDVHAFPESVCKADPRWAGPGPQLSLFLVGAGARPAVRSTTVAIGFPVRELIKRLALQALAALTDFFYDRFIHGGTLLVGRGPGCLRSAGPFSMAADGGVNVLTPLTLSSREAA